MRLRRITLVAVCILLAVLAAALLTHRNDRGPEVKLVRLVSKTVEPHELVGFSTDRLMADVFHPEPDEVWAASFQILCPMESGFVLSENDIKVEIVGSDGNRTEMALPVRRLRLPVSGDMITKKPIKLTIPSETMSCQFTIGCRPLTARERWGQRLGKWGVGRRFPKVSAWISRRLPNTEHWTELRREVVLPLVVLEQESHNQSVETNRHPASPVGVAAAN